MTRTGILLDEMTSAYRIREVADDVPLLAFGFWVDAVTKQIMLDALGVPDAQLATALSVATGFTFVDERGQTPTVITPPDRTVERYVFRVRGDVMDIIHIPDVNASARIGTPPQDSVITQANWTLIKAQLGVASDAEAIAAYAQAHGASTYPTALENAI